MKYRNGIGTMIAICKEQLKTEMISWHMVGGYLLGICMTALKTIDYLQYCDGKSIQVFEPFIIMMNDYSYSIFLLLGLFLVNVDSPFINSRSIYMAVRADRKSWYFGMLCYMTVQTILYYAVLFISTMLLSFKTAYIQNIWSQKCYMLGVFHPVEALEDWGLSFDGEKIIKNLFPIGTFFVSFLLVVLYSLVILLIAFLINMNGRWIAGNVAAILLHLSGIVLIKSFYSNVLAKYSLLAHSQLVFHKIGEKGITNLYKSLLVFGCVLFMEIIAGMLVARRTDFVIARGDRES